MVLPRTGILQFRIHFCNILFFGKQRRNGTSCSLLLDPSVPSKSTAIIDQKNLFFSLAEMLIERGFLSSACEVVRRIIFQCSSISEVIYAFNFFRMRGMRLDTLSYSYVIQKLIVLQGAQLAESLYVNDILTEGIALDFSLLNSMICCYCKMGKLDEAKSYFDKVVEMKSVPSSGACSAFIVQFCDQGREIEGYDYFVKINAAGVLLHFVCYSRLVLNLCHRGYLDEALIVFNDMLNNGVPPTVNQCKSLAFGFCKRGKVEKAELFITEMESFGFFLDKVIYTSLIYEYCRKNKMKMALRLLFRMLKLKCEPDNYTYNTLIYGFLKLGLFDEAWVLHKMMTESGLKPDAVTYQIMISKFCKDRKVDCGLAVLNNMIKCNIPANVHCYTVLIAALFKENRIEEINHWYNVMLNSGLVPDHVLFFTLIKNHQRGLEMQLALTVLHAIARTGCRIDLPISHTSETSKSSSDIMREIESVLEEIVRIDLSLAQMAFSIYMIALCHGGNLDAACICIDKMVNYGLLPSLSAYNSLIKCLYHDGQADCVEPLLKIIQDQGFVPDRETFLIRVNEHCKLRDFTSAFRFLDQMKEMGIRPGVATYDSIISHLGRKHRIHEAEKLFDEMCEAYIHPDETFYATMINAYSKNGQAIKADRLFMKMLENGVQPTSHSYNALINGLIKKNMTEEACQYIDRMLKDDIKPNTAFYTSLINQFFRKMEFEFALKLLDLMNKGQIEIDRVTYIILLSGCSKIIRWSKRKRYTEISKKAKEKLFDLLHRQSLLLEDKELEVTVKSLDEFVRDVMQTIPNSPFFPNLYLYNGLISCFCWGKRMQDAYIHFRRMQGDGVHPNEVTFTILINGYIRHGDINCAVWLFNEMNAKGYATYRVLYKTMIRGLCWSGRFWEALSVMHMMHKRGLAPSHSSFEDLFISLCKNSSSIHAVKMLQDMHVHGHTPCKDNLNALIDLLRIENKLHEAHVVTDILHSKRSI